MAVDLREMADKWPSALVAREEVGHFTGGLIKPKTMANLDSRGEGPPSITLGRKVAYKTSAYVAWLESRATAVREV